MPNIILATLPHINAQPLAYLYLSQIPYTGLDLGPVGTVVYWVVLVVLSIALAYAMLFWIAPVVNRTVRGLISRASETIKASREAVEKTVSDISASLELAEQTVTHQDVPDYSSYHGFKSFARDGVLSIEDIVNGLSSHKHYAAPEPVPQMPAPMTEPVYDTVEPIYEHVEPIEEIRVSAPIAQVSVREFASTLVGGDRAAVFAGLRQHIRGGGALDNLITLVACELDDVYRSRIDGSSCDESLARLTARLDTQTLEKLIGALATAVDSSYSDKVTGAKLALTRALSVLGA